MSHIFTKLKRKTLNTNCYEFPYRNDFINISLYIPYFPRMKNVSEQCKYTIYINHMSFNDENKHTLLQKILIKSSSNIIFHINIFKIYIMFTHELNLILTNPVLRSDTNKRIINHFIKYLVYKELFYI